MCRRNSWASYPLSASTCSPADQLLRLGDVVLLPSGQDESQGVAQGVHAHVNLGAEPAAAPAQGLGRLATLFGGAPAAQGCARTTVLSMIRYSDPRRRRNVDAFVPRRLGPNGQSFVDAVQFPYSAGSSRHWAPERLIHKTASTKRRQSASWPIGEPRKSRILGW